MSRQSLPLPRSFRKSVPAILALIAAAFAAGAFAQIAQPALDATVKFPGGVTMHGDVVYASIRGFRPLTLDLYLPERSSPLPLVIFVHGGAWAGGTARSAEIIGDNFPSMWAQLSSKGYAVASINYRLSSEAKFPSQVQDLNAAIRFLRSKAAMYGIDEQRVVVWGASAGAHIAMLSALDCRQGKLDAAPADSPSTCVTALIDWFGPTQFDTSKPSPTMLAYVGCSPSECGQTWARTSVLDAVSAKAPPLLAVHGDADTTVPLAQSKALIDKLAGVGVKARLDVVPNGNHLFRGATRPDIDTAIRRSFEFIDEQLQTRPIP